MVAENWIRKKRKSVHLSQAKLANLLGVKQYRLSQWELGKAHPSESMEERIRQALEGIDRSQVRRLNRRRVVHQGSFSPQRSPYESREDLEEIVHAKDGDSKRDSVPRPKAIALFAGCGGMSLGFRAAGFDVVGFVELQEAFRAIYECNFPEAACLGTDIRRVEADSILGWREEFGTIDLLFGGPPCQGFSLAGKRERTDPRNQLFYEFARVAAVLEPKAIIMENVRVLTSMRSRRGSKIPDLVLRAFEEAGFRCEHAVLNAQDYGVPQSRERVFFLGLNQDWRNAPIVFPRKTHGPKNQSTLFTGPLKPLVTFRDATADLESLESGERSAEDPWHFAVDHPPHVVEWLKDVPEGKSAHDNPDPNLRPRSGYNTTYKRIRWDEPCSTIGTTFGMISGSRNVHPTDTRSLTVREAMRCQTFPDDFVLFGNLGDVRTAIGNAVPPLLAEVIATHLLSYFSEDPDGSLAR